MRELTVFCRSTNSDVSFRQQYHYLFLSYSIQLFERTIFSEFATTSEITRLEVLGYHKLTQHEESYFKDIFNVISVISPSVEVFSEAIKLRKAHNMKIGDGIIAGTAIVNNLPLYTRNVIDFRNITELELINPIL